MQKKNIFNKKDSINFDEDLFGKMNDELSNDSSFDISISESDKKFPVQKLQKDKPKVEKP